MVETFIVAGGILSLSSLSLQLPDVHAAVGGSSALGCAAQAGNGSHQVIWMRWERSALAWAWCNSCCAASGQAGKTVTATHVSHPLHVASLATSPWAQETGLGTFSVTEAMWRRVSCILYCLIPLVLHPQWEWLLIVRPVGGWSQPLSTARDSESGGTDNHTPGTGRGPRLFFSSLTKMYLLLVGSSPAWASHILLVLCLYNWDRKDTLLGYEFLDLFCIYLWVSGTVPHFPPWVQGKYFPSSGWKFWSEERATDLLGTSSLQRVHPGSGVCAQPLQWDTRHLPASSPIPPMKAPDSRAGQRSHLWVGIRYNGGTEQHNQKPWEGSNQ